MIFISKKTTRHADNPHGLMQKNPRRNIWVFPKIEVPQNGWFVMENPILLKCFGGTPIFGNTHIIRTEPVSLPVVWPLRCVFELVVVGFGQQHWIEPTLTKNYSPEN